MTNTTRTDARKKMAAFIAAQCSATLDETATIVADHIVVSGSTAECMLVALYMTTILKVPGVVVDPEDTDPDLAGWTCCRIPEAGLHAALKRAVAEQAR